MKHTYYLSDSEAEALMTLLSAKARHHISTMNTERLFDGHHNIVTFTVLTDGVQVELARG